MVAETLLEGEHDEGTFCEKTTYEYSFNENEDVTEVKSRTRRTSGDPAGSYDSTTTYTYALGNNKVKKTVTEGPDGVKHVTEYIVVDEETQYGTLEYAQDRIAKSWTEDASGNKTDEVEYAYYGSDDSMRKFKLAWVQNACCGTTEYDWNADHTLKSVEDPLGNKTEYVYSYADSGSFDQPWKVKRPGQNGQTLEMVHTYTASNQIETATFPPAESGAEQFVVEYEYDDDGRITQVRRRYGSTYTSRVKYAYATDGSAFLEKIERAEDPNDAGEEYEWVVMAAYTYDLSGAVTKVRNGQDNPQSGGDSEVQSIYDEYGRIAKKRVRKAGAPGTDETDDYFVVTTYDYYPNGGIWKVTDARGVTVEHEYCDDNNVNAGKLETIDFPNDSDIAYTYDATTGYVTQVTQGGLSVLWSYDNFGRLKQYTDVWGKTINIDGYDASGRITAWRYPGYSAGSEIAYSYDDVGRLTTITDKMPAGDDQVTEIDYDQDTGAMVTVTLPNDTVTTLEYDNLGRLTALVNAKSEGGETITSYAYDYTNNGVHSGFGQVEQITHEDGRYDTFAYDAHERLITEHYRTPQDTTLFRYGYEYDDDGNRLSKQYDGNANKVVWFSDETDRTMIDNDFGPSNQLARMWTGSGKTTGTKHTVCGSFEDENIASIEVVSKTTGDTEVDSVTAQIRDGLFIARALNFFDGSNLATKATATATDLANYTDVETNTGIDLDTTLDVWYEYDAAGRRTKKCEAGEYDSGDPYTQYYWNDAGYLKQVDIDYGTDATPRYARAWLTWDPTGELVKLEIRSGSVLTELTPGSGGTLVYLTKWTYFGGAVLVERDEVPATPKEKEYVSVAGAYLYQVDASDAYWYYRYDGGGSVAALTDASENIKALYEYDSFGLKLTNAGTVENTFGFYGGTLLEKVGLIHQGGPRFYEAETGVNLSRRSDLGNSTTRATSVAVAALAFAGALVLAGRGRIRRSVAFLAICIGVGAVLCLVTVPYGFPAGSWKFNVTRHADQPGQVDLEIGYRPDAEEAERCEEIFFRQIAWSQYRTRHGWRNTNLGGWHCDPPGSDRYPDQRPLPHSDGSVSAAMSDDPGRSPGVGRSNMRQRFETCAVCEECESGQLVALSCIRWQLTVSNNRAQTVFIQTAGDRDTGRRPLVLLPASDERACGVMNMAGLPASETFLSLYDDMH